jgi:TRAP-type uncharacterized transport system substrate-binding protein
MRLIPNSNNFVVLSSSGIKSVADLKGKRVSVGPAGGGLEPNAKTILEAYGLSYKRAVAQTAFLKNLEPKTLALDVFNTDETCWHDSVDFIGKQAFHPV